MAQKKIEIIYDINGKAIDVAIDKTLNLKQAVRELTKEVNKTQEGTDQFRLLSAKLNETKDNMDRVKAKSSELFGTLSLLPGPIGDFSQKTQGVVDLLKTFSGFKLSDVGNQFKELGNDIRGITSNLFGLSKTTDELKSKDDKLNETVKETSSSFDKTAASTAAAGEKIKSYKGSVDELKTSTKLAANETIGFVDGQAQVMTAAENAAGATNKAGQGIANLGNAETGATVKAGLLARALQAVGFSANAAAIAVGVLETALAAIGIGIVIAGLVALGSALVDGATYLYKWASGALAAEEATKRLSKALIDSNDEFEKNGKILKRTGEERIALLKSQGASEETIRKQGIDNLVKDRDLTAKTLGQTVDILKQLQKNRGKNDEENNKQIEAALKKKKELEEKYKDQSSAIKVAELNNVTEKNKAILEANKKAADDANKLAEKRLADDLTLLEKEKQLSEELIVLAEKTERGKALKEIEGQRDKEKREIEKLNIDKKYEGVRSKALLELEERYQLKKTEINKKYDEEDYKKKKEADEKLAKEKEEASKKLNEIEIGALEEGVTKQKAIREAKYKDDLKELDKLFKDKLISEKEYQTAVINLNQGLVNDLKKIDDDKKKKDQEDKLKKLDDDLKFLQIQTDAEKNSFVAYWDDRQKLLDKSKERELAAVDLTESQKLDIEKKYVQLSKDLQKEKLQAYLGYVTAGLGVISGFFSQQQAINGLAMDNELAKVKGNAEEEDKIKEKYFYKNRDAQKGQAIIATLQSAIQAYSALAGIPVVGPFLGAAAAAAALVFGYKQVDLIAGQTYQSSNTSANSGSAPTIPNYGKNYGEGGMIGGKRHAAGGTMVNAEAGEAIMTRGAVSMFGPMLSLMNQAGGGTTFSTNMRTTSPDNPKSSYPSSANQSPVFKTYVVSNELTSEAQKQARLKDLSTL
jgi:uncharacterized protein YoxC